MTKNERLNTLVQLLQDQTLPVSGQALSKKLHVSRQVIVQDIALLRAQGVSILSTNKGYYIQASPIRRIIKVHHTDEQMEEELNTIVDAGAWVENVFVEHETYGHLEAELNIHSRRDVKHFLEQINTGNGTPLTHLTNGVHFHTIQASSKEILDDVCRDLDKLGILC